MNSICFGLVVFGMFLSMICLASSKSDKKDDFTWSEQYGYSRASFNVGENWGFIILPAKEKIRKSMPWVWYAPTFKDVLPSESNSWIGKRLLAEGIAICGMDIGESYGNPQGRASYTEFHKYIVRKFKLSKKACLWAQSRGGLMLFNWASEHPDLVKCIGGTYPVCDIASYPGIAGACSAYGMTESELQSHLKEHDPIDRLAPLASHKIPVLLIHGDDDSVVPLERNTAEFARRYQALKGPVELEIIKGKGHAEIPEFFESDKFINFFIRQATNRK